MASLGMTKGAVSKVMSRLQDKRLVRRASHAADARAQVLALTRAGRALVPALAREAEVMYPQFLRLSRAAGCVGYVTWITGRHVTYFGRRGETHVERFPGS